MPAGGEEDVAGLLEANQLQSLLGRNPNEMTGCVLASLLTGMADEVKVTLGAVKAEDSLAHYRHLEKLGIKPAALQVDGYFLPEDKQAGFKGKRAETT